VKDENLDEKLILPVSTKKLILLEVFLICLYDNISSGVYQTDGFGGWEMRGQKNALLWTGRWTK
jgi:hypothetical protein